MVGKVLTGNGITAYGNGAYSLIGGDELSDAERDALQQLCRQRLDTFREQRGEEVFAHRTRHRSPISGSVKYRVLTRARGRCECCGAHEHQRALEVDHIIPNNQDGSDAISNLQALFFRCNAGKRDGCLTTQEGAPTSAECRPAMATAKRAACSARWWAAAGCRSSPQHGEPIAERMLGVAEHVRNSMLGRGERTHSDQILITNRSEAG